MDDNDTEDRDAFSRQSEARVCEQVLGDARHGLADGANGTSART